MITDTRTNNLRIVLHQIWANLYVEFVVKNPLSPVEHPGGIGVANELFEMGLDSFIVSAFLQFSGRAKLTLAKELGIPLMSDSIWFYVVSQWPG